MPVFISYSHSDAKFAERLAFQLVKASAQVWIDRWELTVGDSLIQKIQEAVAGASALLVILSKSSVRSEWTKKEINTGLLRELEEKRVVVLPVLLEDCEIPLFLRDKLYADFRSDFDVGLAAVKKAIDRVTNDTRSRVQVGDGTVDWGLDWGFSKEGLLRLTLTFIEAYTDRPNTVLTQVNILASEGATRRYHAYDSIDLAWACRHLIIETVFAIATKDDFRMILNGPMPRSRELVIQDSGGAEDFEYRVAIDVRLLGDDTGFDLLVDIGAQLHGAIRHFRAAVRKLTADEAAKVKAL